MQTKVARWGNSLAVRIPGALARDLALLEGAEVTVSIDGGRLVLQPQRGRPTLDSLVEAISDDNLHAEIDWGTVSGIESW